MNEIIFKCKKPPVLKPIPIKTKEGNWFRRVKGWFSTRKWELEENFYFNINNLPCFIPKGFVFDGASVPRFFWSLLHPTGILMIPSIIHDFGYKNRFINGYNVNGNKPIKITKYFTFQKRKKWDILFCKIAIAVNGFGTINKITYLGVRAGGWVAFNKYRRHEDGIRKR